MVEVLETPVTYGRKKRTYMIEAAAGKKSEFLTAA
jgi:hypothetical protein